MIITSICISWNYHVHTKINSFVVDGWLALINVHMHVCCSAQNAGQNVFSLKCLPVTHETLFNAYLVSHFLYPGPFHCLDLNGKYIHQTAIKVTPMSAALFISVWIGKIHTLKCIGFNSIQIYELLSCLNTESKIDIWKMRTICPVF